MSNAVNPQKSPQGHISQKIFKVRAYSREGDLLEGWGFLSSTQKYNQGKFFLSV